METNRYSNKQDIINNIRDDIKKTNNTATQVFNNILDEQIGQKKTLKELNFPDKMSGDLDLTELTNRGFNNINTINIGKGNITELLNLPSSIKKLYCSDNLLVELSGLPRQLEELHINNNHITTLDLKDLTELLVLNCSSNKLVQIDNLPKSLTKLYCVNNNILTIDLRNLHNLRELDITANANSLHILNIPSLEVFKYDQDKMVTVSHIPNDKPMYLYGGNGDDDSMDTASKRNYLEDLNEYFKMKTLYETNYKQRKEKAYNSALLKGNTIKNSKKMASKVAPLCINCSAVGGTNFRKVDGKYSAICNGLNKKCNLNIKIFTGVHYNFDDLFKEYSKEIENTKQEIIIQKMNTLFNYIKDELTTDKFKKVLKDYSTKNEIFRDLTTVYKLLNNNDHKKKLIDKKMENIYNIIDRMDNIHKTYKDELNPQLIKDLVYIKVKELDPEILALRQLKYELCEMYTNDNNEDELFQREIALSNITYSFDEQPHTIKYVKK